MKTSEPEILEHFTKISALLSRSPVAASHFTDVQMAPVKEGRGESQGASASGQLLGCSAPTLLLPILKCQRAISMKLPALPCSHRADIPETQTSQVLLRMFFATKHEMKAQKLKLLQVKQGSRGGAGPHSEHTHSIPTHGQHSFSGLSQLWLQTTKTHLELSSRAENARRATEPSSKHLLRILPAPKHPKHP